LLGDRPDHRGYGLPMTTKRFGRARARFQRLTRTWRLVTRLRTGTKLNFAAANARAYRKLTILDRSKSRLIPLPLSQIGVT
jgi:hypothetical protein